MIKVNSEKCTGCGLCESICPNVFKLNEDTFKSEVISQEAGDCNIDEAINSCPQEAIIKE